MATASIPLPVLGGVLDATDPPGIGFSSGRPKLLFDDTTPELVRWEFRMPANYSSAPILKIHYSMASATSGDIEFEGSIMAVSDGDTQDMDANSFDTVNSQAATVPGTAGYPDVISLTLTNADSLAAGDYICILLSRDADDGSNDTATGDGEVWAVSLDYTVT